MHPFLLHEPLPLSSYAVMAVFGYLACVAVATRLGHRDGISKKAMVDITFWLLIAAIVGARLAYLLELVPLCSGPCSLPDTADANCAVCDDWWRFWRGGFVFYGGFVGAVLALAVLGRRYGLRFWPTADALAPGLALAHFFGRIGCFLGGCCYGEVTTLSVGLRFPEGSLVGDGLPRHATQLYEAGAEFVIFLLLLLWFRRRRFEGQILLGWLGLYGVVRFLIETMRGDVARGYATRIQWPWLQELLGMPVDAAPFLSWAQVVSLAMILLSLAVGLWLRLRHKGSRC